MDKSGKRQRIEIGEWKRNGDFYCREIIIHNPIYNISYYYNDLIDAFKETSQSLQNVVEGYRQRNKGEKQNDYIGTLAGLHQTKNGGSYYLKKGQYIDMTLPGGSKVKGIIRVSNHSVDIGTFAEQNPDVDYGISLVVGKIERQFEDKPKPENRDIHIFEYTLAKKFENSGVVLMNIIDRIQAIKLEGWNISSQVGIRDTPVDMTNKTKIFSESTTIVTINESHLRQMIREVLKEYINKQFKK